MANVDVQVVIHHESALPADDVVNTLHFDVNAPDTVGGLLQGIADAYQANLVGLLSGAVHGMTLKAYDSGPNPAGPTATLEVPTFDPPGGRAPSELALCLSYATVDDPEASLPRRRGRVFIGPLTASAVSAERPADTVRDALLDWAAAIAAVGTTLNTTWVMYSQRDATYAKIESTWVDNAWDVQRRRGLKPSNRRLRDVQ
jgi:hypothetical protein